MGPTRQVTVSDAELRSLAFLADVPPDDTDDFVAGMKSIVPMPLESVMQTLCAVNYILNGEKVSLADLTIYDELQTDFSSQMAAEKQDASTGHPASLHNTLSLEQTLMSMIRKGDTAALSEWAKNAPAIRGGVLAFDQLRQMKNLFIVSVTLASRAAIRGGMDADDALMLSDRYIQHCELMNTAEEITNLQFHMISDYTARVERLHIGSDPSQLIAAVSNYIQHHLSEPITTEQIAASLYISRTHLSARFHKETGTTLSDYILKEKTEEAKRLPPLYGQISCGNLRLPRLFIAKPFFKSLPQIRGDHARRIPHKARGTLTRPSGRPCCGTPRRIPQALSRRPFT